MSLKTRCKSYLERMILVGGNLNESILSQYNEDLYNELCIQADYYGEDSLTEEQQYVLHNFKNWIQ